MPHIQIVGCPRSGNTLMQELMINCFRLDGFARTEESLLDSPRVAAGIRCTKNPWDTDVVRWLLPIDRDLWVIYLLRDPRDVIVSRHGRRPEVFWANLRLWRRAQSAVQGLLGHPRFLQVRYEDLVERPDETQRLIAERMPFLEPKARFSQFCGDEAASGQSRLALHGPRPVDTASIGRWCAQRARVAAQLARHGDLTEELIALGYETERDWLGQVDDKRPESAQSFWPESLPWHKQAAAAAKTIAANRFPNRNAGPSKNGQGGNQQGRNDTDHDLGDHRPERDAKRSGVHIHKFNQEEAQKGMELAHTKDDEAIKVVLSFN